MSVHVSINGGGGSEMDITRPTVHALVDAPADGFRQAADILVEIADDIRRMYPAPKEET